LKKKKGSARIATHSGWILAENAERSFAKPYEGRKMKHFSEAGSISKLVLQGAIAVAALGLCAPRLDALSCNVVKHPAPTDADKAMLAGDYDKAEGLYKAALAKQPGDTDATEGLVHALLRQQKVDDADDAVKDALDAAPKSSALITLRGEVELREGEPWLVEPTVVEAYKIDPCNPRTRLLFARVLELSSRYATARQQIQIAHEFDPADPEIRLMWMQTLPLPQRVTELEAYLSAPNGADQQELAQLHAQLDRLKKQADEPAKACRLSSAASSGEIPFIRLAGYEGHTRAYGLEVAMNGKTTRLQIDTRGAGLTVYRAAADRVGLKRLGVEEKSSGASAGAKPTYTASADVLRIGDFEFHDCAVNVIDAASPFDDGDGQIGVDVFSDFMVTVDFPMRKLGLGPLPARPGEIARAPSLKTIAADFDPLESLIEPAKPAAAGAEAAAAAPAPKGIGPFDRFIAPEMKDYTQIYRAGHDLILSTALDNEKIKLFIPDAAAPETNISASTALDLAKVHEDKTLEQPGPGGRVQKVFVVDEATFNFAHVAQKLNGVVSTDTSLASTGDGMDISGFIGMNTLSLLTLHIDYRDGLLKADYVPGRGYKFEDNSSPQ
jgi:tetratricopeptide (TPR) repeat protein